MVDLTATSYFLMGVLVLLDTLAQVDLLTTTVQVIMEKVVAVEPDKMAVTLVMENHRVMVVEE